MKEINTEILINASRKMVWEILTDFSRYPRWNPFIKSISGKPEYGERLKIRIEPPDVRGMTFKPRIITYLPDKELRWLGHMLVPGLFDGEHIYRLIDNGNGSTTFIQGEKFRGLLVPFFNRMIDNNIVEGFNNMNRIIRDLAEKESKTLHDAQE